MRKTIIILITAVYSFCANGQINSATLDYNGISAVVNASGLLFHDLSNSSPGFEYPKGSGKNLIFSMSEWYSGIDNWGNLKMAASEGQFFTPHENGDFSPGPLRVTPGTGNNTTVFPFGLATTTSSIMQDYNKVWVVRKAEIDSFIVWSTTSPNWPGYTVPQSIINWPAHSDVSQELSFYLAPFVDVNGNGVYDPYWDGDYPDIKGDFCAFTVYNDNGGAHQTSGAGFMGVEIRQMVYGYITDPSCLNHDLLNSTLFIDRRIILRSTQSFTDFSMGIFVDPDIGNGMDDFVGCDVNRSMMYSYNGDDSDEGANGYGSNIPALGVILLEGIQQDTTGMDDSVGVAINQSINGFGYGNGIVDDEKLGLTGFTILDESPLTNVSTADDRYNLMNGNYTNGSPFMDPGGETKFIYPDSSNTHGYLQSGTIYAPWNETIEGNTPGERRMIAFSGDCLLTPGGFRDVKLAVVVGPETNGGLASVNALRYRADQIRTMHELGLGPCDELGIQEITESNVSIYPNPAKTVLHIQGISEQAEIKIFDVLGGMVMKSIITNNINIENLKSGMYVIQILENNEVKTLHFMKQ